MKHLAIVLLLTAAAWAQDQGVKGFTSTIPCDIEAARPPVPTSSANQPASVRLRSQCYPTTRNGGAPQGYGRSLTVPTYALYQHQPKGNGNVAPGYTRPQVGGNYPGT